MPARDWIPRFSVTRPVTVVTAFLVVLVVGVIATVRIPLQMMPSGFSPPFLWVWIPYEDSTPVETEARIVKPIEDQVSTVPGLKRLESESKSDNASLSLEFHSSIDMDEAYNAVTDRLERAMPSLPTDVERTYIWRFDPTDEPVIWAGISVPAGVEDLHYLVTRVVQKRIERIPGVGRVDVWGVDEAIVWIDFDREALLSHGIELVSLMERLGSDNFQLASGQVTDRGQVRYVRALARFESLEVIQRWPVADDDQAKLRLPNGVAPQDLGKSAQQGGLILDWLNPPDRTDDEQVLALPFDRQQVQTAPGFRKKDIGIDTVVDLLHPPSGNARLSNQYALEVA